MKPLVRTVSVGIRLTPAEIDALEARAEREQKSPSRLAAELVALGLGLARD